MPHSKHSGLTAIDLFAGCGGLSLGLELNGFHTLLFSELNKDAAATYRANRPREDLLEVGDIHDLTNLKIRELKKEWHKEGIHDVDIVTGGPPCQGYSKIGHRRTFKLNKHQIPSNQLFKEMIRVVKAVRPRSFLFENVSGLLTARWTPDGAKGEIFRDVLREFRRIKGYIVRWELVHAKDYGVPQNRPRILIIGIRTDVGFKPKQRPQRDERTIIKPSAIMDRLLPERTGNPPNLIDLLGDLVDPAFDLDDPAFRRVAATRHYPYDATEDIQLELRSPSKTGPATKKGYPVTDHDYSRHSRPIRDKFAHMHAHQGRILESMQTKKFAQRLLPEKWSKGGPNITATSLPDDFVHFSQARTLSVREWARLQLFPDWYVFKGPRTTGGRRRAGDPHAGIWERDVPKYTQIGNAVPVGLARAVGAHLAKILRRR